MTSINVGGLSSNGAVPKLGISQNYQPAKSNIGASLKLPSSANQQNTGLIQNSRPIQTPAPAPQIGTHQGLINPAPKTAVKKVSTTSPTGSVMTVEYHPEVKNSAPKPSLTPAELTANTEKNNTANYNPQPTPAPLTVGGQAPGVLATGNQTANENQLQREVLKAGQTTPDERAFQDQYVKSVAGKQFGDLAPYAESSMYVGKSPEELQGLITAPDLAGRASADNGLYNTLGTAYGNAALAGLTAAQTSATRNLTANTTAYTGSQNQATRAREAAESVLNATAPQFPSYGSQVVQPGLLGTNSGTGDATLQSAVSNVVQKLQSGTMSYNDAVSALSGYGQGGLNALQQALPSNFNIAQSNTLAGQQGTIGVNYQLADAALSNVENLIQGLGSLQKTNVPGINKVANWISTQFGVGSEQTRAVTGAVQSLRNAYASLLASSKGGTPTDYSGQAQAEIPNEPTPNDIAAIRKNFETLGQARKDILGNPGQAGGTSGGSSGGFGWDALNY